MRAMLAGAAGVGGHSCLTVGKLRCLHFEGRRYDYPPSDVLISDSTAGPVGQPLHPFHRPDALPRGPFKGGGDGGAMPKKDAPRASVDAAGGNARRKRPVWLPLPVATYARQINCQTKSDELMLRRLTSDPRMMRVWTELQKRKRSDYESSDTFKYPATDRIDWHAAEREQLRRAQSIRRMPGSDAESAAKNSEVGAKFYWAAWTATTAISE